MLLVFPRITAEMRRFLIATLLVLISPALSYGGETSVEIPAGTILSIRLLQNIPMSAGERIHGQTLYPIYVHNHLAVPTGSDVQGLVVRLDSDHSRRIHARLRGDFTPFHIPVVRFDRLALPGEDSQAILTDTAKDGIQVLRLSTPKAEKRRSFLSQQISQGKQKVRNAVAQITDPGLGDRALQLLYSQLPYHPERIAKGTSWTVALAQPFDLRVKDDRQAKFVPEQDPRGKAVADGASLDPGHRFNLHAYLAQKISSADEKPGDTFSAIVCEPIYEKGHTLTIPEGSILIGEITRAKPARSFGRQGQLRFHFKELKLPDGFRQPVQGSFAGIAADQSANLRIDSEGGMKPASKSRILVPLALSLLAGRALDEDGNLAAHTAVASNGLGLVGRVVGIAAGSRGLAAGIGFYQTALVVYDRWIARGQNVVFEKNTRIDATMILSGAALALPRR